MYPEVGTSAETECDKNKQSQVFCRSLHLHFNFYFTKEFNGSSLGGTLARISGKLQMGQQDSWGGKLPCSCEHAQLICSQAPREKNKANTIILIYSWEQLFVLVFKTM